MGMLDGTRIVAFHHFLMGPLGVQFLADLGADVVAVEHTKGAFQRHWSGGESFVEGESMLFACANRNKRSLALDLRAPGGIEIAKRLIENSDVVVENFRPGVMDRLGIGFEDARNLRPDIIYASATGYGTTGPYCERPGQDLLIQAASGIVAATSHHERGARAVGFSVVDHHGAALLANGILAALVRKGRTGEGCRVEASLMAAAIDVQTEALVAYMNGRSRPESIAQQDNVAGWLMQAPYGIYPAADGHVAISLCTLANLASAIECQPLAKISDTEMFSRKGEISRLVASATQKFGRDVLIERLLEKDVWCMPVQDYSELVNDKQVEAGRHIQEFASASSGRPIRITSHPIEYDGERPGVRLPPQPLGAQTEEVLRELGYSPDEISQLSTQGTIGIWKQDAKTNDAAE